MVAKWHLFASPIHRGSDRALKPPPITSLATLQLSEIPAGILFPFHFVVIRCGNIFFSNKSWGAGYAEFHTQYQLLRCFFACTGLQNTPVMGGSLSASTLSSFPLICPCATAKVSRLHCHQQDKVQQRDTILGSLPYMDNSSIASPTACSQGSGRTAPKLWQSTTNHILAKELNNNN